MPSYYLYLLNEAGHIKAREILEAADDDSAVSKTESYLREYNAVPGAEVWLGQRRVKGAQSDSRGLVAVGYVGNEDRWVNWRPSCTTKAHVRSRGGPIRATKWPDSHRSAYFAHGRNNSMSSARLSAAASSPRLKGSKLPTLSRSTKKHR